MIFWTTPEPSCHSFPEGSSKVFWMAVISWTMVMSPFMMPKLSWIPWWVDGVLSCWQGSRQCWYSWVNWHSLVVHIHHKHGAISRRGIDDDPSGSTILVGPGLLCGNRDNTITLIWHWWNLTPGRRKWSSCWWQGSCSQPWLSYASCGRWNLTRTYRLCSWGQCRGYWWQQHPLCKSWRQSWWPGTQYDPIIHSYIHHHVSGRSLALHEKIGMEGREAESLSWFSLILPFILHSRTFWKFLIFAFFLFVETFPISKLFP